MSDSLSRRGFVATVSAAGVVASSALNAAPADAASLPLTSPPDPLNIFKQKKGWRVRPTGGDDHDNLEWALRNTPRGGVVKLDPGVFKIGSPIVVADFDGSLIGDGRARTTLTCTDAFSLEVWEAPGGPKDMGQPMPPPFPRVRLDGSSTFSPPVLIQFYKTPLRPGESAASRANRITISDFRCRGAMVGAPWMFGDEVLCINIINSIDWHAPEAKPATTRQDVTISGVEVDGYRSTAFGPFGNACACITVLGGIVLTSNYNLDGDVDGDALGAPNGGLLEVTPADGDFALINCTFRNCRVGPGVVGYRNGSAVFANVTTDGCRGNCLQIFDNSNMLIHVRECDLFCDSFLLPPAFVLGATDVPSSLGCVVAIQGLAAAIGFPPNIQWLRLAYDPAAHAAHPEAGPIGTWRPRGPSAIPAPSQLRIDNNDCRSSLTPNTYCFHAADLAKLAFGYSTLATRIANNDCADSQTCVSLEHVQNGLVLDNKCSSRAVGVELHNSPAAIVKNNAFAFLGGAAGCEILSLSLGEKIDLSRVAPGAGTCAAQA